MIAPTNSFSLGDVGTGLNTIQTGIQTYNQISGAIGGSTSSDAIATYYDGLVKRLGQNIIGPMALYSELSDGIFEGKTVTQWDGREIGGGAGPLERDFFRFLAVNVGAIDSGYRTRSTGPREAFDAFARYAAEIDKLAGSNLASYVTYDGASPMGFYRELMKIPVAKMADVNRYFINDQGLPGTLAVDYSSIGGTTSGSGISGDKTTTTNRILGELGKVGTDLLHTIENTVKAGIEGAIGGARTAAGGAETGSQVGGKLTNPLFVVLVVAAVFFAVKMIRKGR